MAILPSIVKVYWPLRLSIDWRHLKHGYDPENDDFGLLNMVWACKAGRYESFGLARVQINEIQISEGLLYLEAQIWRLTPVFPPGILEPVWPPG